MRAPIGQDKARHRVIAVAQAALYNLVINRSVKLGLGLAVGDFGNTAPDKPAARSEALCLCQARIKIARVSFKTQIGQRHRRRRDQTPVCAHGVVTIAEPITGPAFVLL